MSGEPFGLTLPSAGLIPEFVAQALATGIFVHPEDTQITPLDDLKDWLRAEPGRPGELFESVAEALLGEERAAARAAERAGVAFDRVGFELDRMDADSTFEAFDPAWTGRILRLVLEEADALQAHSRRVHGTDFALAVSFELPDPRRHRRLSSEAIAAAFAEAGRSDVAAALGARRAVRLDLQGAFQLDLSERGAAPPLADAHGVAFRQVPCEDPRGGDACDAHLCLAYPAASAPYFRLAFETLRADLNLAGIRDAP